MMRNLIKSKILFTIFLFAVLAACASVDKLKGGHKASNEDADSKASNSGTKWIAGDCNISQTVWAFSSDMTSATETYEHFINGSCASSADKTTRSWAVGTRDSATMAGVKEIDLVSGNAQYVISDPIEIVNANSQKYYGFSDWQSGVSKDITGIEKLGSGSTGTLSSGEKHFNIIRIDQNKLYTGDAAGNIEGGSATAETRPSKIEQSDYFTLVQ